MGRIKGFYEWDNDDLTPGQKSEGGLHQNLFDNEGKLKGNARFVPDEANDSDPLIVTETVYVPAEERRRTREDDELRELIKVLVEAGLEYGIAKATPHVSRWWQEKARPGIAALPGKLRERRMERKEKGAPITPDAHDPHGSQELSSHVRTDRPPMSKAEAQARYLAALAARAYSDEQMRLVESAEIIDGEGMPELQRSIAELPADQTRKLIEAMASDPTRLGEDTLAELASVLGRHDSSKAEGQRRLR